MVALPICDELHCTVNSADWEPQFILYCQRAMGDDVRLARQINALCDNFTEVIERREILLLNWTCWLLNCWSKRALFVDVPHGLSDSSLFLRHL
ncbi:hypothetical protein Tco_1295817 [Tanacetum coccineum]